MLPRRGRVMSVPCAQPVNDDVAQRDLQVRISSCRGIVVFIRLFALARHYEHYRTIVSPLHRSRGFKAMSLRCASRHPSAGHTSFGSGGKGAPRFSRTSSAQLRICVQPSQSSQEDGQSLEEIPQRKRACGQTACPLGGTARMSGPAW